MTAAAIEAALFVGLCDDAAIFPPGNLSLEQAVPDHLAHRAGPRSPLVGPLVVAAADLPAVARIAADLPVDSLDLAVTVPSPAAVGDVLDAVKGIQAARLEILEVVVPPGLSASAVVPMLAVVLGDGGDLTIYVEVPRDERRDAVLAELGASPYLAKFRTGGVRADLYPDEQELAESVTAAVRYRVPFKATAGLHHAIRNTDPVTGFEQHGYLNLLAATDAALAGAGVPELTGLLAERDADRVAQLVRGISPRARSVFRSFGTCSIDEPVTELADLGLLNRDHLEELS